MYEQCRGCFALISWRFACFSWFKVDQVVLQSIDNFKTDMPAGLSRSRVGTTLSNDVIKKVLIFNKIPCNHRQFYSRP